MQAVSDATPLIHLSKIRKILYLKKVFNKIYLPQEIFDEVVTKGKNLEMKEIFPIEELIDQNFLIVKDVSANIEIPTLHVGELKAMSLCKQLRVKTLLIDEKEGFEAAKLLNLHPLRTTALLLRLLNKRIIKFNEYKESLLKLSESGYFLRAETYQKLLEAGKKLKR